MYPYPAAPPLYNLTWYVGALGLPFDSPTLNDEKRIVGSGLGGITAYFGGFEDFYPNDQEYENHLAKLDQRVQDCLDEGQPFLSLFLFHPRSSGCWTSSTSPGLPTA